MDVTLSKTFLTENLNSYGILKRKIRIWTTFQDDILSLDIPIF